MLHRGGWRSSAVLIAIAAVSGAAFASVRPLITPVRLSAVEAGAPQATASALTLAQIEAAVLQQLKTKAQGVLQSAITKTLKSQAGLKSIELGTISALKAPQTQAQLILATDQALIAKQNIKAIQTDMVNALTAVQSQAKIQAALSKEINTAGVSQTLQKIATSQGFITQTQASSSYVQGQSKIITGQATSTGNPATVLTVPGLLHVTATWEPSDGTVVFYVFNDSGGSLDFGADVSGFQYEDTFAVASAPGPTTQFGMLSNLANGDGTIAIAGSYNFQITPRPDAVDLPGQQVPYRGEAHIQVTAPGSAIATLDLSAFEIAQNNGMMGNGGSALISGQAVVGTA
jgi:hypothetical protein